MTRCEPRLSGAEIAALVGPGARPPRLRSAHRLQTSRGDHGLRMVIDASLTGVARRRVITDVHEVDAHLAARGTFLPDAGQRSPDDAPACIRRAHVSACVPPLDIGPRSPVPSTRGISSAMLRVTSGFRPDESAGATRGDSTRRNHLSWPRSHIPGGRDWDEAKIPVMIVAFSHCRFRSRLSTNDDGGCASPASGGKAP
jgi:hypothetical protein